MIDLADGKQKAIETIQFGDLVVSFNEQTGQLETKPVDKVYVRQTDKLIILVLANGQIIRVTDEHPFYVNGKWFPAKDLQVGDRLFGLKGEKIRIEKIIQELKQITFYNLKVRDNHNYFAAGVLVHNKGDKHDGEIGDLQLQKLEEVDQSLTVLEGSVSVDYSHQAIQLKQTVQDLIQITQNNTNLSELTRGHFVGELREIETGFAVLEPALLENKLRNIANQISLQQAEKALQDGYQAKTAQRNLDLARSNLDILKENLPEGTNKEGFEKLAQDIFWEQALIQENHYLQNLETLVERFVQESRLIGLKAGLQQIQEGVGQNLRNIVQNAQNQFVQKELAEINKQKQLIMEVGSEFLKATSHRREKQFNYGHPKNDPPFMFLEEKEYQIKHLFDLERQNNQDRIKVKLDEYQIRYQQLLAMPEGEQKREVILKYWNDLTSAIEDARTKERKWSHVKRWKKYGDNRGGKILPYYIRNYQEYIQPFEAELEQLANFQASKGRQLTNLRKKLDIDYLKPYLQDQETGLYWYDGQLSPISLDNYDKLLYSAHQGSRYLTSEGYYRLHAGQDIGSYAGGYDLKGTPVRSLINGTVKNNQELLIETGDGYAIRYRHMPPSSYLHLIGKQVTANDIVGEVGGWSVLKQSKLY